MSGIKYFIFILFMSFFIINVNAENNYEIGDSVILKDGTRWHVINKSNEENDSVTLLNDSGLFEINGSRGYIFKESTHLQDYPTYNNSQSNEIWTTFNSEVNYKVFDTETRLLSFSDLQNLGCTIDSNDYNQPVCSTYFDWFSKNLYYNDSLELMENYQNFWIGEKRGDDSWNQHYAFRHTGNEAWGQGGEVNKIVSIPNDWTNTIRPVVDINKNYIAPQIEFANTDYKTLLLLDYDINNVITEDTTYDIDDNFDFNSDYYQPTKDGYVFDGWYLDSEYQNKIDASTVFSGKAKVYAKFVEKSANNQTEDNNDVEVTSSNNDNVLKTVTNTNNPRTVDNIKRVSLILVISLITMIELIMLKITYVD